MRVCSIVKLAAVSSALALAAGYPTPATAKVVTVSPASPSDPMQRRESLRERCACDSVWVGSILYKLELPATTFVFGDTITFHYTVTNRGDTPAEFVFPVMCQYYFAAVEGTCRPFDEGCIAEWEVPNACYQMSSGFSLAPGETKEFSYGWRQHFQGGVPAWPGNYTAWAALYWPYWDETLLSVPFAIVPYGPRPIQDALDASWPWDTVRVEPGVYHENVFLMNRVLIGGGTPEETIIDGGGRGGAIFVSGTAILEGFTIRGGAEDDEWGALEELGGGVTVLEHSSPNLRNLRITGNRARAGGGMKLNTDSAPAIENCLFLENSAIEEGGALSQEYGNAVTHIERCTFARNTAPMGAAIYDRAYGNSHLVLQRSIFYENAAGEGSAAIDCRDSGGGGTTCSDFWGNEPADRFDCSAGANNIALDPRFCAPDVGNFMLQNTSPCAPGNAIPLCGQIGAYGVGCLTTGIVEAPGTGGLDVAPSPFDRSVRISIGDVQGAEVRVAVYAASGALVWERVLPRAARSVTWDGMDRAGRRVPSGVYVVRATDGVRQLGSRLIVSLD